jgi:Beta-propeller domains of methanol dehydrogenase type
MKRILSAFLSLLLVLLLLSLVSVPLFADDTSENIPLSLPSTNEDLPRVPQGTLSGNLLVVDHAELLSASERSKLEARANNISAAHGCEVAVLTVNGTGGKTAQEYADDYFVYNNYGFGPEHSGIMLFLDMYERDWHVVTRGFAINAFPDDDIDFMISRFKPALSDGDYYEAFSVYYDYAEKILGVYDGTLSQSEVDEINEEFTNFMNGTEPEKPNYVKKGIMSVLLGGLAGFVPVTAQKSALKTVRKRRDAAGYAREGSLNLQVNRDIYLYSNVTSHVIQRTETHSSSGGSHSIGSGHSSTHTHSSGATLGGHGGKF